MTNDQSLTKFGRGQNSSLPVLCFLCQGLMEIRVSSEVGQGPYERTEHVIETRSERRVESAPSQAVNMH